MSPIILSVLLVVLALVILIVLGPILIRRIYYEKHPGEIRTVHDHTVNDGKFLYDLVRVIWHRHILKEKLVINLHYKIAEQAENEAVDSTELSVPGQLPQFVKRAECTAKEEQQCTREQFWTNRPSNKILEAGYLPVTGMSRVSSLAWWGVPVYMSITGAEKFIVPRDKDPKTGQFIYPQHTPALIENKIRSQAYINFLKKFKKAGGPEMDTQSIIMLALLGVGAIVGLWWLGII